LINVTLMIESMNLWS